MVGLEALAFSVPQYFINLSDLAVAREIDPDKYTVGLGQREMSIATPCEDAVTLAAGSGWRLLSNFDIDPKSIALLIVGTETGIDHSKPIASYVHELLGLPSLCRSFEIKHACYGGMAGLFTASQWTMSGCAAGKKALVIATDIARYGAGAPGEPTQGAGAVAMLISDNPVLLEFDMDAEGYYSNQVMDFWRPIYSKEAFADGHYSISCYLDALQYSYAAYRWAAGHDGDRHFADRFVACLYHTPFVKMAQKAHQRLLETDAGAPFAPDSPELRSVKGDFARRVAPSLEINARVGNIYTGSLFLSLVNFLEDQGEGAAGRSISLFSYGSGCQAEFITARVGERAGQVMKRQSFRTILDGRAQLLMILEEQPLESAEPLARALQDICKRVAAQSNGRAWLKHFAERVRHYLLSSGWERGLGDADAVSDVSTYVKMRLHASACAPSFILEVIGFIHLKNMLPSFGSENGQAHRYVTGLELWMRGYVEWGMHARRYKDF